ncbi:MAG: hypothetical protein LBH69_05545 [Methanomassiliicoccaceae archaeon]|jgi:TM2 domain-containing membrane protein YozV|nr:hypothetical protein [Methanomassiliicoccaceae archaeon]
MYCNKCGIQIADQQEFCGGCGQKAGGSVQMQSYVALREKSSGAAALLSFLWAGLGHLYIGKIALGLVLMLIYPVVLGLGFFVLVGAMGLFGLVLFAVIVLAVWIWCIFDAHKRANEYNDFLRANGKRPW